MSEMRRGIVWATVIMWLAAGASAAGAQGSRAIVTGSDMGRFPRVTLEVMLPVAVAGDALSAEFEVTENGREARVVESGRRDGSPDVMLLLDTSGSMEGRSMAASVVAAKRFMSGLDEEARVGVIPFADRPSVAVPLAGTRSDAEAALSRLEARGETALNDALALAARQGKGPGTETPVIVLLSDGGDTVSRLDLGGAVSRLKAAGMPVIVVALPSAESDFRALRTIADQTGGRFIAVPSVERLERSYADLAEEVSSAWSVTYMSNRPSTTDLEVAVTARGSRGSAATTVVLRNPAFVPGDDRTPVLTDMAPANLAVLWGAAMLAFVSAFAGTVSVALFLYRPRTRLADMRFYDQLHDAERSGPRPDDRLSESVYGAMERVVGKGGLKRVVHESLEQAGLPLRPTEYSAIHLLGVVSVGFAAQAFSGRFLVSVLAVLAATVSPILWVRWRIASRHRRFEEQLPDTLSLIASSLRAGWGLQHAFTLVVEQSAEPIRGEFARATTEIRLGLSVEESLFSIADRVHSVDFRWTATAISVQREVGGNLAEVLDIVASTMRERSALRRHIAGLVAEGRLSAMILIALPFGLAIVLSLVNPEYMRELVTTTPGVVMLVSGVILLIGGAYWLRRSIAIEV